MTFFDALHMQRQIYPERPDSAEVVVARAHRRPSSQSLRAIIAEAAANTAKLQEAEDDGGRSRR